MSLQQKKTGALKTEMLKLIQQALLLHVAPNKS
jgi:hypothetical protein